MTDKNDDVQVSPDVMFNGLWYTITAPNGQTWTMEDDDKDEGYIEGALYCWSRWLDYVKAERDASGA